MGGLTLLFLKCAMYKCLGIIDTRDPVSTGISLAKDREEEKLVEVEKGRELYEF